MADRERGDKVKVVDRRWLTPEGVPRDDAPAPAPSEPETAPAQAVAPPEPAATRAEEPRARDATRDSGGPGLADLVDFFAQQALAALSGEVPGRPRDVDAARYFIDLLGVVHDRTAGRLVAEEARYLEDVLFQLRSLYVAATR